MNIGENIKLWIIRYLVLGLLLSSSERVAANATQIFNNSSYINPANLQSIENYHLVTGVGVVNIFYKFHF